MSWTPGAAFATSMTAAGATHVWIDDHGVTVALVGDLVSAVGRALPALRDLPSKRLTLDLTGVTHVDGEGLDLLMRLVDRAADHGAQIRYRRAVLAGSLIDLREEDVEYADA